MQRYLFGPAGLALLVALYLLPGLIGHDPWRGDDARYFGPVLSMLQGEGLLFPTIAGEPSTEFPPLYYWTSALLAAIGDAVLAVHDAARLATALFTALTIFWIARAAQRLYGKQARMPAALLTLGTLGLVVHAHEMQPMVALMAMQALTLAGLALVPARPVAGSVQAGLGAALAFLAGGLPGLLLTLPLFVVVVVLSPECRNPRASAGLILGLCLAVVVAAIWPLLLHYQAPGLLAQWWQAEWARFGDDPLRMKDAGTLLELLGWFVWPLWPIAAWALWRARRQLVHIGSALPIAAVLSALAWIVGNGSLAPPAMLPLIAPFALLAAAGVPTLRRGAANAFDWFAIMTFAVFVVLVWIAWTAQVFFWPPGLARHLARVAPGFELRGTTTQAVLGITIVVTWVALAWRMPRSPSRAPANWAMGMTMLWCLAVVLLMPWFDYDRSYRPAATSLSIALAGERPGCVAAIGLSASQRASFHYFAGLRPERVTGNETACPFLLVYADRNSAAVTPAAPWQPIWEYRRGGGRQLEIFRLYRRD